jgi:hypothetical protein
MVLGLKGKLSVRRGVTAAMADWAAGEWGALRRIMMRWPVVEGEEEVEDVEDVKDVEDVEDVEEGEDRSFASLRMTGGTLWMILGALGTLGMTVGESSERRRRARDSSMTKTVSGASR